MLVRGEWSVVSFVLDGFICLPDSEDPPPTQWTSLENMNLRFADMNAFLDWYVSAFQAAFPPKIFLHKQTFQWVRKPIKALVRLYTDSNQSPITTPSQLCQ